MLSTRLRKSAHTDLVNTERQMLSNLAPTSSRKESIQSSIPLFSSALSIAAVSAGNTPRTPPMAFIFCRVS